MKLMPMLGKRLACDKTDAHETCPCCGGSSYLSDFEPAGILSPAPVIKAKAWYKTGFKDINLADYKGKYVVLFFYPMDFTFVCPTEIIEFSKKAVKFRENSKSPVLTHGSRLRGHRLLD